MHVAAALGVPTLAVFGPTDPKETGPLGPRARFVREPVECSPCLYRDCPIDHRCMERIGVERVYEEAMGLVLTEARAS
jgi:heptosyltransferase-2